MEFGSDPLGHYGLNLMEFGLGPWQRIWRDEPRREPWPSLGVFCQVLLSSHADNGNVGIGTSSPKTELNIAANNSGQGAKLTIENSLLQMLQHVLVSPALATTKSRLRSDDA